MSKQHFRNIFIGQFESRVFPLNQRYNGISQFGVG